VLWNGLSPTLLDVEPGCFQAVGAAINNNGLIIGTNYCYTPTLRLEATVWHGTTPELLPEVGTNARLTSGRAFGMNDMGMVVGESSTSATQFAAAWVNGDVKKLADAPGRVVAATANAVNNRNMIVGKEEYPMLWSNVDAAPLELNKLISEQDAKAYTLDEPVAINDRCDILVSGVSNVTYMFVGLLLTMDDPSLCNGQLAPP
jgi:hypothetical protein